MDYIITGILFLGAVFLCYSFSPMQKLIEEMPAGGMKRKWNDVRALILFFIIGYALFIYLHFNHIEGGLELIVPAVFFLGAVLVMFIGTLALETSKDMKRIFTLQYENVTDHLIGIRNRRYLDRKIAEEILRARRYGMELSMLLLDIDHFKSVNDTHGHQIGDRVLKSLGQLLVEKVRDTDLVARYGGEEMAILCPQTTVSAAFDLAERMRQAIETSVMVPADEYGNKQEITITVSIGVAEFDQQVTDSQGLIKRADEALYKAKETGRNRVVLFSEALG
jgi:diguanylate cyclase (GGDEF)-like protein